MGSRLFWIPPLDENQKPSAKRSALAALAQRKRKTLALSTIDPGDPSQPHRSLAAFCLVDAGTGPAALAIHVSDLSGHSALEATPHIQGFGSAREVPMDELAQAFKA